MKISYLIGRATIGGQQNQYGRAWKLPVLLQGLYYLVTGLWPLFHIQSFLWVTGPKHDLWLVKMVALLSISISVSILLSYNRTSANQGLTLHYTTALSFLLIDCYYAANKTISPVYFADAGIQFIFILLLILTGRKKRHY